MSELLTALSRATEAEALALNESGILCELIDGQIVRKTVGTPQAFLTSQLIYLLNIFLDKNDLGFTCTPDLLIRFAPELLLSPDVSFTRWDRCPGGKLPNDAIAVIMPNLAVEVLSPSNRPGEMARKLDIYFSGGVELVWLIDPATRTAAVYTSRDLFIDLGLTDTLTGGSVLPGFALPLSQLFARLG